MLLIEEAKLKYPIGTKFYPAHTKYSDKDNNYCIITDDTSYVEVEPGQVVAMIGSEKWKLSNEVKYGNTVLNRVLLYKGKWAKIIETPKSDIMTKDEIMAKALRDYPIGTIFDSTGGNINCEVTSDTIICFENNEKNDLELRSSDKKEYHGTIWCKSRDCWAVIKDNSKSLLEQAKSKFPIGTEFKSTYQNDIAKVKDLNFEYYKSKGDYTQVIENSDGGWVYCKEKGWAEIVTFVLNKSELERQAREIFKNGDSLNNSSCGYTCNFKINKPDFELYWRTEGKYNELMITKIGGSYTIWSEKTKQWATIVSREPITITPVNGEIYVTTEHYYILRYTIDGEKCNNIWGNQWYKGSGNFNKGYKFQRPTEEEAKWFIACEKADKFIPKHEALMEPKVWKVGDYVVVLEHEVSKCAKKDWCYKITSMGVQGNYMYNSRNAIAPERKLREATKQEIDYWNLLGKEFDINELSKIITCDTIEEGKTYVFDYKAGGSDFINKITNKSRNECSSVTLGGAYNSYQIKDNYNSEVKHIRLATEEERCWLEDCIKAGRYIPLEESHQLRHSMDLNLNNTKIWLGDNKQMNKLVQEKLWELGWKWNSDINRSTNTYNYYSNICLNIRGSEKVMSYSTTYNSAKERVIFPSDLGIPIGVENSKYVTGCDPYEDKPFNGLIVKAEKIKEIQVKNEMPVILIPKKITKKQTILII